MKTAKEMRANKSVYQEYTTRLSEYATVEMRPICEWHGRTYVLLGKIGLSMQAQAVDVIDITDDLNVARFSRAWPQNAYDHDHAVVIFPDEGHPAVLLLEDGSELWAYIASLPVQLRPPAPADAERVLGEVEDYDVAQVDAGGQLQIG